jgi:hypothetical protein
MNTWKVVLATLVIFATGVFTGGLLVAHSQQIKLREIRMIQRESGARQPGAGRIQNADPRQQPNPTPNFPQQARLELLRRIEREMTLTSGQREKIETIIREGQERTRQIMEPVQPELGKEIRATQQRIREILTEEQRVNFDELMKQRPQRRLEEQPMQDRRPREQRRQLPSPDSADRPSMPESKPLPREN